MKEESTPQHYHHQKNDWGEIKVKNEHSWEDVGGLKISDLQVPGRIFYPSAPLLTIVWSQTSISITISLSAM